MERFAGGVSASVVVVVLLVAAAGHAVRPGALRDAIAAHRLLPSRLAPAVAAIAVAAEIALGAGGVVAAVTGIGALVVFVGAAVLFAGYAGYAGLVVASGRGGAPCGCAGSDVPLGPWVVVRAAVLAVVAVIAVVAAPGVGELTAPEVAVTGMAAATFALLLWQLPAAMRQPEEGRPA